MSTVILTSSRGDGELRIDPTTTSEMFHVSVDIGGLHARADIDATAASRSGWRRASSVLVSSPEQGLEDLCGFVVENSDGWFAEELWQSRDGNLQLGFSHRDDHVCVAVTLKHHGQDGWVASTHVDIALRDVGSMVSRLRELMGPVVV